MHVELSMFNCPCAEETVYQFLVKIKLCKLATLSSLWRC